MPDDITGMVLVGISNLHFLLQEEKKNTSINVLMPVKNRNIFTGITGMVLVVINNLRLLFQAENKNPSISLLIPVKNGKFSG